MNQTTSTINKLASLSVYSQFDHGLVIKKGDVQTAFNVSAKVAVEMLKALENADLAEFRKGARGYETRAILR